MSVQNANQKRDSVGSQPHVPLVHFLKAQRRGFTLLEVLLVLAILVAIGAVVTPSLGEAFQRHQVQAAIQSLRGEWERARLTAMKTGQAQAFTCVPGTNQYSVQPYMSDADLVNASAGATVAVAGSVAQIGSGNMLSAAPTSTEPSNMKTLDKEIVFVRCVVSTDMRAMSVTQAQGGMTALGSINELVLFYPDGTTSTAELVIQNLRGDARAVRMRGLTGHSQIHVLPSVPPTTQGAAVAPTTPNPNATAP